jgi:hypothetical protein
MLVLVVSLASAGTFERTCAATQASASANAGWEILGNRGLDGATDAKAGVDTANAAVRGAWGGERTVDLCPKDDRMGGLQVATEKMLEVQLPKPGQERTCLTTAAARATGGSTGEATVARDAIRASARASADIAVVTTNSASLGADVGAGGRFTGEWAWKGKGPNTEVRGTVTIRADQAYAAGSLDVPGLVQVRVWEGQVDAWVREGDVYRRVQQAVPVTLQPWAVLAGAKGSLCVTGTSSLGALADPRSKEFRGESGMDVAFDVAPSAQSPKAPAGDIPEFEPCGCE